MYADISLDDALNAAKRSGAIPMPISGEPIDRFMMRVAQAAASVTLAWMDAQERAAAEANADTVSAEAEDAEMTYHPS
jgi:hypothetical protein